MNISCNMIAKFQVQLGREFLDFLTHSQSICSKQLRSKRVCGGLEWFSENRGVSESDTIARQLRYDDQVLCIQKHHNQLEDRYKCKYPLGKQKCLTSPSCRRG